MNAYSLENLNFEQITLQRLRILLRILSENSKSDTEYIREKYSKQATDFEDNVAFLCAVGLVLESDSALRLTASINTEIAHWEEVILLDTIFKKAKPKIPALVSYLSNFVSIKGVYVYRPLTDEKLRTSGIRNFLLELKFLEHDGDDTYLVAPDKAHYLVSFLRRTSAVRFASTLRDRDEIGIAAEEAVIRYEQNLLKDRKDLQERIKHISRHDVGAGYDIESFEVFQDSKYTEKYIEVKAVSGLTFDFFWTSNEIEVAKAYGSKYFLYLVPVVGRGKFDIDGLKIIRDPYRNLFENTSEHDIDCVLYRVSPFRDQK